MGGRLKTISYFGLASCFYLYDIHYSWLFIRLEEEGPGVEIEDKTEVCPGNSGEIAINEGAQIEALKSASRISIPDPDEWLNEYIKRNVLLTTIDYALDWAKRSSLWTTVCFPACCAFEFIATAASRFDISRFGMEIIRASPRQADLMITAGTLTWKMAPQVKRIYDQMAEPNLVIPGALAYHGDFANS
jgi:hypothetical protein